MLDDLHLPESPDKVISNAEKVLPILETTNKVRKEEMKKLMDQVGESLKDVGPYATVITHSDKKGDFVILNQPVDIPGSNKKGLIIITNDGFICYQRQEGNQIMVTDDDLGLFPGLITQGSEMRYFLLDGKPLLYDSKGSTKLPLDFVDNDNVVVEAINTSITKAQEGPKKAIAHNQTTIQAANAGQVAIATAAMVTK